MKYIKKQKSTLMKTQASAAPAVPSVRETCLCSPPTAGSGESRPPRAPLGFQGTGAVVQKSAEFAELKNGFNHLKLPLLGGEKIPQTWVFLGVWGVVPIPCSFQTNSHSYLMNPNEFKQTLRLRPSTNQLSLSTSISPGALRPRGLGLQDERLQLMTSPLGHRP